MKLLFVHERFGALAGAEANAFITANELGSRGNQIGILHGPGTGQAESNWKETFPTRFALEKKDNRDLTLDVLKRFRPDVVYVHKMPDLSVIETLVESGIPLVRMVHDHDIYCMRSYKYNVFTRQICTRPAGLHCVTSCLGNIVRNPSGPLPIKFASYSEKLREIELNRSFDRMVVVTTYMRDELIRNGFDPQRIEIHAPVPRNVDDSIRSSFSDRNLIVYAGQIVRGKGVDVLLRSLARVKSEFECIILGDGNHRVRCERLARKLGLQDRVHFKGFVPQEELRRYYQECSVIALSSVWPEPIATIGLEVMRYGLPVVAFDAGGIHDWLQDGYNGRLVPWMDQRAFATGLDQLLADKSCARAMGENGRRLVSERYHFGRYIEGLGEMFQQVTEGQFRTSSVARHSLVA